MSLWVDLQFTFKRNVADCCFSCLDVGRATDDFAKVLNWTIGSLSAAVKRLKKWLVGTSGGHQWWAWRVERWMCRDLGAKRREITRPSSKVGTTTTSADHNMVSDIEVALHQCARLPFHISNACRYITASFQYRCMITVEACDGGDTSK